MAFVDDLVIFGKNEACFQNQINIILSWLKECGLNIILIMIYMQL